MRACSAPRRPHVTSTEPQLCDASRGLLLQLGEWEDQAAERALSGLETSTSAGAADARVRVPATACERGGRAFNVCVCFFLCV